MTGLDALIAWGREQLEKADVPGAARDARVLLEAAGIAMAAEAISPMEQSRYQTAIARRVQREPVSHIVGRRAFWRHEFFVTGDVLDPRPETETLIDAATALGARCAGGTPFQRVLDLGTGSGCILLSLLAEVPSAVGVGVDVSEDALAVAARNAQQLGLEARAQLICSDWFETVAGEFDLIVSNPPYIAVSEMRDLSPEVRDWEPHLALTPGGDGLEAYRRIIARAEEFLCDAGVLMVEIGPTQAEAVQKLFEAAGFGGLTLIQDLDGRDRVISGEKRRNW